MGNKVFFIFFVWLLQCFSIKAQPAPYQFNRIDINKGLSNNQVNCIYKDPKGFMWFGTTFGLNRYDGTKFKIFKHNARDSTSINDDIIYRILEGPEGKLWVETRYRFSIFDFSTESFNNNISAELKKLALPDATINNIIKDKAGDFWFLISNRHLYKYKTSNKTTSLVYSGESDADPVKSFIKDQSGTGWLIKASGIIEKLDGKTNKIVNSIKAVNSINKNQKFNYKIFADAQNELWIYAPGDEIGAFNYKPATNELRVINKDQPGCRLNNNNIAGILQDDKGKLWISTDHGGINVLDKATFTMHYILSNEDDNKSLSQNSIVSSYKDSTGIIWIGTYKKGVNYYFENNVNFPHYKRHPGSKNSLPYDDVNRFVEDAKGNLWIGTNGGGLIYYDRSKSTYTQYTHDPADGASLANDVIVSLCLDHKQQLWIGTYLGGMDRLEGNRFIHYQHDPANPLSLADNRVFEIFEDSKKSLWVGTLRGGLDSFDQAKNIFFHHTAIDGSSVKSDNIFAIAEDRENNLWIGTAYGLSVYNKKTAKYEHYIHSDTDPESISHSNIICMLEDSRGLIWIGTGDGLNVFNKKTKTFQYFRIENGLPTNVILNILEDDEHQLWLSSAEGLVNIKVNINKEGLIIITPKIYGESDGLQGKAFNENAALKTSRGELIFGGANGFNIFNPKNIVINKTVPNFAITDLQVFNKSISVGETIGDRILLVKSINQTEGITLKNSEDVFSIEFADLNLSSTQRNGYAYKLEGFSKTWLTINDKVQRATFTNLDAGNYTFMVRSSNGDGSWNNEVKLLNIKVLPPFWKTPQAFMLYFVLVAGILLFARYLLLQKAKLKYEIRHERHEANRMHELDMMKIKFFTNVSHEFRTPLSLIITPLDKIIKHTDEPVQKQHFQLIQRNAKRLLNMVNQLLDFRKLEVQEIKLNLSKGDIVQFIKDAVACFTDIAEKKQVQLAFQSTVNELEAVFDKDKLERILFNLLSNAFKFTLEKGNVTVLVSELSTEHFGKECRQVQIKVMDTGIGIPAGKIEKIFENFFSNKSNGYRYWYTSRKNRKDI